MEAVDKGNEQMGAIERTIAGLPGIRGYKAKEMRREADKQVRDTLVTELERRRDRVTGLQQDLLSAGGLLWMDVMERVVGRLQLLIDRVRTAAYGYTPFFDLEKVKEEELDRLAAYDQSLFESLPTLDQSIAGLETAIRGNENIQGALQAVATPVNDLNDKFGRRMEAMRTG